MKELFAKLSKRLDLVVTAVLLFLLALTGYLWTSERGYVAPDPEAPPPKRWDIKIPITRAIRANPDDPDPGNLPEFDEVKDFFLEANPDINNDEKARRVIVVNMFDIKTVEEEERRREELNQQYNQAERLFRNKEYDGAMNIVQEILGQDPTHREARDLRNRITTLTNPAPTGTPAEEEEDDAQ